MYIYHGSAKGIELKYRQVYGFFRPFCRYGGHGELIRFKEYYRIPRWHEHISLVFTGVYRGIFSQSFVRIRL